MFFQKFFPKKTKKVSIAGFSDLFFVETARLDDKKDVLPYIQSEASRLLKDENGEENGNYYYAYTFKDQILNFLVARSVEHIDGKLPVVLLAFFAPGKYVYRSGRRYFVIEHNEDGTMATDILYERQEDCIDLTDFDPEDPDNEFALPPDIPSTLYMKWSLAGKNYNVNIILAAMMFVAMCNLFYQSSSYEKVSQKARILKNTPQTTESNKPSGSNISILPDLIKEIAGKLNQKGSVSSIKGDGGKLVITLRFDNELDAREFIKKNGGVYEDGKVVLGYGAANTGNAVSGH